MITEYVLGFAFSEPIGHFEVALIKKTKPDWQAGKWNGIGGKIEKGEAPLDSMVREFKEETGVDTHPGIWQPFAVMELTLAQVRCYAAYLLDHDFLSINTTTEEQVRRWDVYEVLDSEKVLPNLLWLVPMAISRLRNPKSPRLIIYDAGH